MEKIAKLEQIPANGCFVVELKGKKIALYNVDGKVYATEAECTHMKAPLCKGKILQGKYVQCPWHGATFSLETGEVMSGPTEKPIKVYKVKVENSEVFIEI